MVCRTAKRWSPVSYTHLDVYKRQILEAVGQVEERSPQTVREHMDKVQARMRELLGTATVDEPVSYTHLSRWTDARPPRRS